MVKTNKKKEINFGCYSKKKSIEKKKKIKAEKNFYFTWHIKRIIKAYYNLFGIMIMIIDVSILLYHSRQILV